MNVKKYSRAKDIKSMCFKCFGFAYLFASPKIKAILYRNMSDLFDELDNCNYL